jgi:chemotaxis signal transduction protein
VRTIVRFRAPTGEYALPVEHVKEVRPATDLTALPAARAGVAGVVPRGDDVLTVLSELGEPGSHVIVIEEGGVAFGLLVDEVTGVHRVDDEAIGPPPRGQQHGQVAGVIVEDVGVVLLLDAAGLRRRLTA